MTKFEIYTDEFELRAPGDCPDQSANDILSFYQEDCDGAYPKLEATFDTIEDARAEFTQNYADYGLTRLERGYIGYFLRGRIAWIEENEYDENGEFDQGGDVWDYSAQPFIREEVDA